MVLIKWAILGPFLFIFILFQQTVDYSWIRTRIVRVEGQHADHLTTTTAISSYNHHRALVVIGRDYLK